MVCLYTLASLNFTLSVSEYVTASVTEKTSYISTRTKSVLCCAVVFHMCACKTLTVSRK